MRFFRRCLVAALSCAFAMVAIAPGGTTARAASPGITVSAVGLTAGRLVIAGTASKAGLVVSIQGTTFKATANAQKQFAFNVSYRTPDCKLTLVTTTGTLPLLIGNCGPSGVNPKGNWSAAVSYIGDDLALYAGTTYRALRANKGKRPDINVSDWQAFAAKGATGATGLMGPKGDKGEPGDGGPLAVTIRREAVCRAVSDYVEDPMPVGSIYTCSAACAVDEIGILGVTWQTNKASGETAAKAAAAIASEPQAGGGELSVITAGFVNDGGPADEVTYDQHLVILCLPL